MGLRFGCSEVQLPVKCQAMLLSVSHFISANESTSPNMYRARFV